MPNNCETSCQWRNRRRTKRIISSGGFTFLEIVVVVLVVGVLSAAAGHRFADTLAHHRLKQAAAQVRGDVQWAQSLARTRCQPITVIFDRPQSSYLLVGVNDPAHPSKAYAVKLAERGVSLGSVSFGGSPSLTFNAFGVPSSSGTVILQVAGRQQTVTVAAQTGVASTP